MKGTRNSPHDESVVVPLGSSSAWSSLTENGLPSRGLLLHNNDPNVAVVAVGCVFPWGCEWGRSLGLPGRNGGYAEDDAEEVHRLESCGRKWCGRMTGPTLASSVGACELSEGRL